MKTKIKWVKGNSKLNKLGTIGFGIPAFRSADGFTTCPKAGACAALCYARQGSYTWPVVKAAREHNLQMAKRDDFADIAILELSSMNPKSVRIHDSGDFFNQKYLDAWKRIAASLPSTKFYAYTKSLHLDFGGAPANLMIVQSQGGKLDHMIDRSKPHAVIFGTERDRIDAGYVQGNGKRGDAPAMNGEIKIGLVYHGSRKAKAEQLEAVGL